MTAPARSRLLPPQPVAAKVPEITAWFWVVKVLTTGTGEAASDFLGATSRVLAAGLGALGLAGALWWQFRTRRYSAGVYWLAVLAVAVFGTMAADAVHVVLGLPYTVTTPLYAAATAAVLLLWHRDQGTLSIHTITTRRRETWYWLTVLATFALGTAAGDLTAVSLHLGFLASAVLFAVLMVAVAAGRRWLRVGEVLAFWSAYVLTRPLGASVADWLGKPPHRTGLGLGDGPVSAVATLGIVVLVAVLAVTGRDVQRGPSPVPAAADSLV